MEGRDKPHAVKEKAFTNDRNYDTICSLMSLPVWDRTAKKTRRQAEVDDAFAGVSETVSSLRETLICYANSTV
jgi:hypothetical protein